MKNLTKSFLLVMLVAIILGSSVLVGCRNPFIDNIVSSENQDTPKPENKPDVKPENPSNTPDNSVEDDDIYVLGDMVMGDHSNIEKIRQLKGRIHLIRGNHDTDARMKKYAELDNIVEICEGKFMRYKKYFLFLSHFPSITDNVEKETLRKATLNLFGHTHQESHFYGDNPYMYNVGIDAHNGYLILLDDILTEMKENFKLHFEN